MHSLSIYLLTVILALVSFADHSKLYAGSAAETLEGINKPSIEESFKAPPNSAKPWVFWFWINGNISLEGITKDLEAMKRVGINGVLWMEVSGPWWAPRGPIEAGTQEWDDAMQWAIAEADRLGMDFDLTVDFGYGCGGPHITPDKSMQKLVSTETSVVGGKVVSLRLKKPVSDYRPALKKVWLRPGEKVAPEVLKALKEVDSYKDIAVFAIKAGANKASVISAKDLSRYGGVEYEGMLPPFEKKKLPPAVPSEHIIDLTDRMNSDGELQWSAPEGSWRVIRLGHASSFKFTRPSPTAVVGLESDRLNSQGIDAHFEHHLKPILEAAGKKAGRALTHIHIDSWEAGGQNWSEGFAEEFKKRRGYDIRPWLPVLTGNVVQSAEMTGRFLWDMRMTVSEVMLDNYIDRLKRRISPYGVKFSSEPYGHFSVDSLTYGGRADFPIAEFWTNRPSGKNSGKNSKQPPAMYGRIEGQAGLDKYCLTTIKGVASVANTYGRSRVGAEAFTGSRGWGDHPWLLKAAGDHAFSKGINHYIYHLSAHQPYENMVPGMTHRKWGQHMQRHQPWWEFSAPYFEYVTRCQYLLRQGRTTVDFACLFREGAPVNIKTDPVEFDCPPGYDYDLCTPEIIMQMKYRDGRIHLPSGASYRYLVLPAAGELTLKTAKKIGELRLAGASIFIQTPISGTPGLEGYPESDTAVRDLAKQWPMIPKSGWKSVLDADQMVPDFEGQSLHWIHRSSAGLDAYFVANAKEETVERECVFRIAGKAAELWDPETGEIYPLPEAQQADGRTRVTLKFQPLQSWFVVFRDKPSVQVSKQNPFASWKPVTEIEGHWSLRFLPDWGTKKTLTLEKLESWAKHPDPLVKYYSGRARYQSEFEFSGSTENLFLDLGTVEVMARVRLNGKDCGSAWKPPYRVDVSQAIKQGTNTLDIDVASTWVNRMIGDEQLPVDGHWKNWETLTDWPEWFSKGGQNPTGRFTLSSVRFYRKNSPLRPSGLLGPVQILRRK
jgi:hypothetical protein